MKNHTSYTIIMVGIIFATILVPRIEAEELFLNYDTVYVVTSVNPNFTLELRVDEQVQSLKLFAAELSFDSSRLDTVSFTEGTFWDTTGAMTSFGGYLQDSDSTLRLEGLVFGGGVSADGPGLLATFALKGISSGEVDLVFDYYVLKDVNGTEIPTSVSGTKVLIDIPPIPLNLVEPSMGSTVNKLPDESFKLVWTTSASVYPGEFVDYRLEYGTSFTFDPLETITIDGISDTLYTLYANDFPQVPTTYFWRVTAIGNLYGLESPGTPNPSSFEYTFGAVPPEDFDLTLPLHATEIDLTTNTTVQFDWEDAVSVIPNDTIKYILYVGPEPSFPGTEVFKDSVFDFSELTVPHDQLPFSTTVYWQVVAINKFAMTTWSSSMYTEVFFYRGDANGSSKVNVSDVAYLVSYLFGIPTGDEPFPLVSADANCSGLGNVSDVVYLVSYLFGIPSGPEPYCP